MCGAEKFRNWFRVIFEYAHRHTFFLFVCTPFSEVFSWRNRASERARERERAVSVACDDSAWPCGKLLAMPTHPGAAAEIC